MNNAPYGDFVEKKINSIILENKNIQSYYVDCNDEEETITLNLSYRNFNVKIKYGENLTEDYSFIEPANSDKSLITKFTFPFSQLSYSIYDVHNAVEDPVFRTYVFHCLYNENSIDSAFDTVIDFINRNVKIISAIHDNDRLREKLEQSFAQGLKVASKKLTLDKINENPEKYLKKHDADLHFLRFGETAFSDFVNKKNTAAIQKFYTKHHKKDELLTYEERYLEHLFENDFNFTQEEFVEEVEEREKSSRQSERKEKIPVAIGVVLAIVTEILIGVFVERGLEKNYLLLKEPTLDKIIPAILLTVGFAAIAYAPTEICISKFKKGYEKAQIGLKEFAAVTLVGILIVGLTGTYSYFDYQKNVGLGDGSVYYCQRLGKAEMLSYDDVKLYLIEGDYYGDEYSETEDDKRIVVVKNDNYKDYFISDYLTEIDMPRTYRDNLSYSGKFKSLDDFCTEYGV